MVFRKILSYLTGKQQPADYIEHLNILEKQIKKYDIKSNGLKVLIGPSFSIYPPLLVHDRLLAYALKLRGVTVASMSCDALQSVECNYYGGIWSTKPHEANCLTCMRCSDQLWNIQGTEHYKLSAFVSEADRITIDGLVAGIDRKLWFSYKKDGLVFGEWAKDILVNNYGVGNFRLIDDYEELGINHIRNLLLVEKAYLGVIDAVRPDRVISNDSYYGMWAILENICKRKNIPYYSHWGPVGSGSWAYGSNDAAMNLDFRPAWGNFSTQLLTQAQKNKVQKWLDERHLGKSMLIDTASSGGYKTDVFDLNSIDFSKPTAMLAANVIWDLAALNKQVVFDEMIDWIVKTIEWFREHHEYQLIIKPHPAELHPSIPATKERVEIALSSLGIEIPGNVFLLSPKVNLTVYDLLHRLKVLLVHTTTVGIEAVALGLPVLTSAKSPYRGFGFTEDPVTPEEYYSSLKNMMSAEAPSVSPQQKDLVFKFILFYHFHYYTNTNILDYKWGRSAVKVNVESIEELRSGQNSQWNYIIDSIVAGFPIVSEDRWSPES